jgi:NAD(P)H dehydrogenase (quinone)
MKHLIIYSHPNPKSFNHAILETYRATLAQKWHEVRLRDLYALNFDPTLSAKDFELLMKGMAAPDVQEEQTHIRWADVLTFIFPIWWTGLPAKVKGYIDRVFSHGFAFQVDKGGIKGLLGEKKVVVLNTTGTPQNIYQASGMFKSLNQTIGDGIFRFCAMPIVAHKFFSGVTSNLEPERKKMLDEVAALVNEKF